MNDFLPKDYNPDETANKYMKFEQGDNKFRMLEKPAIGYLWWIHEDGTVVEAGEQPTKGNKPVRRAKDNKEAMSVEIYENSKEFWAMPVWNYKKGLLQVLEITQKSILRTITNLFRDEDWGSPLNYDLKVTRTGEKLETEYQTVPLPKKELTDEIKKAFKDAHINVRALFDGGDPFKPEPDIAESGALKGKDLNELEEDTKDIPF